MRANDDGHGSPVSRDEPYYAGDIRPIQPLESVCHTCGQRGIFSTHDYRWFIVRAIRNGWRLAKLTTGDEWTCPGCAAVARANLDAAIREESLEDPNGDPTPL
jgi:hypothetical protein